MNQSAKRVICVFMTVQNGFHFLPVRELDFNPGRESDQQGHEISCYLFLRLHQLLFEVTYVSERESVPGLATAVNLPARFVVLLQEPQSDVGGTFDAFTDAVASAKGADGIETFQREARRINPAVTSSTGFDRLVLLQGLANCCRSSSIGLDGTDTRRRWIRWHFSGVSQISR